VPGGDVAEEGATDLEAADRSELAAVLRAGARLVHLVDPADVGADHALAVLRSLGRAALWSVMCGLAGYLFYGLGLPGSDFLTGVSPGLRGLLIGLGCGLLPLAVVFWMWARGRYSSEPKGAAGV